MMNELRLKFYITKFEDHSKDAYLEGLSTNSDYKKATLYESIKSNRSLFIFSTSNYLRIFLKFIVETKLFEVFILLTILANCCVLALTTPFPQNDSNDLNNKLDRTEIIFLAVFILECVMKIISYGFVIHRKSYLKNGWNILDFLIVVIGTVSYAMSLAQSKFRVDAKVLRAFRVLRPLRLISTLPSIRIVLSSIFTSMKYLADVTFLVIFLITVFSLVGMNLFMGRLHASCYNNVTMTLMINPTACRTDGNSSGYLCTGLITLPPEQQWVCLDQGVMAFNITRWPGPNYGVTNFDNAAWAMLTVFQVVTKEGWTDVLYWMNDSVGPEWPWLYFVSLICIGTYFVMNLTLGILSGNFIKQSSKIMIRRKYNKEKQVKKESEDYIGYKNWIEFSDNIACTKSQTPQAQVPKTDDPDGGYISITAGSNIIRSMISLKQKCYKNLTSVDASINKWQMKIRRMIKGRQFFIIVISMIFLNTAIMATEFANQPQWLTNFQDIANGIFVAFFIVEFVVKIFGLGLRGYFTKILNIFDSIVIFLSLIEMCLQMTNMINSIGLAVLRCARLLRIFKLTRYWKSLQKLTYNMACSLKSAVSLLFLLSLLVVIFSLLGMQLFGGRFTFTTITRTNFDSFVQSVFTVFQIIISEDWNVIMYDGIRSYNDSSGAGGIFALYFILLYVIGNYIFINIFLAIALSSLQSSDTTADQGKEYQHYVVDASCAPKEDTAPRLPEVTNRIVVINGCPMMPPDVQNNILSMNKIKRKTRRRNQNVTRVQIKFNENDIEPNLKDSEWENMTYNELYAEESDGSSVDYFRNDNDHDSHVAEISIPVGSSCFIFKYDNRFRITCFKLVNHALFNNIILYLIIMSSLMLAVEDPLATNSPRNDVLQNFDYFFTCIFTLEILIRVVAYGIILHDGSFLRNGFSWVDVIVVLTSLVDNCLISNTGVSSLKILRIFRVLRPLRAISRAKGLKHVVLCLIMSLKAISKIFIVALVLEFMFAVISVTMLKGSMYSCTDPSRTDGETCKGQFFTYTTDGFYTLKVQSRIWSNYSFNYDNVLNAMLTLFVFITFSNWKTFLYKSIDATGENTGPYLDTNPSIFIFYAVCIVTMAMFTFNIFVAMVVMTFQKEKESEFGKYNLDKNMRNCIDFAIKARPQVRYVPYGSKRYKAWKCVTSRTFDWISLACIILNTISLVSKNADQTTQHSDILKYINVLLTILFTAEVVLKMYAFTLRNYFTKTINVFELLVVIGSIVDMVFSLLQIDEVGFHVNLFRLFRILQLVRLLKKRKSMRDLLWTFVQSLHAIPYVLLLIVLTFFMYAVLGMQFFGKIGLTNYGSSITRNNNFQTFPSSLLVLFRCITGESWQDILISCVDGTKATCQNSTESCGSAMSYIYFTTFIMLCSFLIFNLFVAVIMDNFDYLSRDKSILSPHHLGQFIEAWSQYDIDACGRVNYIDLVNMLSKMNPPLGFGTMCSQISIFRNLIMMNIPLQLDGTVFFNAVLFSLVRNNLKINFIEKYSTNKVIKQKNDELRTIIKTYWRNTNQLLIDQMVPPNISECMTIGKLYATQIIEKWFKQCILIKSESFTEENRSNDDDDVSELSNDNLDNPIKVENNKTFLSEPEPKASFRKGYQRYLDELWKGIRNVFTMPQDQKIINNDV